MGTYTEHSIYTHTYAPTHPTNFVNFAVNTRVIRIFEVVMGTVCFSSFYPRTLVINGISLQVLLVSSLKSVCDRLKVYAFDLKKD